MVQLVVSACQVLDVRRKNGMSACGVVFLSAEFLDCHKEFLDCHENQI